MCPPEIVVQFQLKPHSVNVHWFYCHDSVSGFSDCEEGLVVVVVLQPNGRFETNKKICLSISGHHPETWQPSWSIRTALMAMIAFMPTPGSGTIGSLDYTPEERKVLARKYVGIIPFLDWAVPHSVRRYLNYK